ncbi:GntR family transcriptional regulator [Cohnella silvisoli]|uniref:GntR family transcriptional regulator n=1 Tax=Cohnella silvisoli TaxID=2873699 RepID=A0ABV1KXW1_9BACL|nr:GntR family transcriptional regulator [Cohnella silvisoli]MCD9021882.1 GntR family transcriptional regulator [Cohnella silvisoli]
MDIPLYEQIFNDLFNKIKGGSLKKGERVPSEKELADQFNVSRITSKKALELLSQYRLVERIQGKGSFVAETLPDMQEIRMQRQSDSSEANEEWRTIGVIVPDFSDSFGAALLRGIEEQCSKNGCRIMLKLTYDKREEEEAAIRSFVRLGVDGIIVFPVHGEHYNSELLRLVVDGFPLVFVDRYLKGIAATAVFIDNRKAAFEVTNVLLEKGVKQVGFLSAPAENTSTIEDRLLGFTDACIQKGWTPKPDQIMTNLYSSLPQSFDTPKVQVDIETIRRFVEMNPELTAFVASEYNIALILREVLLSMGKRIPEDYQIVCFDSISQPYGQYLFTHVRQNEREMGLMAVTKLISMWKNEESPLYNIVPHEIVLGQSTLLS